MVKKINLQNTEEYEGEEEEIKEEIRLELSNVRMIFENEEDKVIELKGKLTLTTKWELDEF